VTDALHHFLEPTFADSRYYETSSRRTPHATAAVVGAALGLARHLASPTAVGRAARAAGAIRARFAALHRSSCNKWYFDEADRPRDRAPVRLVRPLRATSFERVVVNGALVGGDVRRGARRLRRRARRAVGLPALLRRAAALGVTGLGALLPDRGVMTIHLSILIFWPLALGSSPALLPRGPPARARSAARRPLAYAI
jgi:hypothetical protein